MADTLREFIYLDTERVRSLASQAGVHKPGLHEAAAEGDATAVERLYLLTEPLVFDGEGVVRVGGDFDFDHWTPQTFRDGAILRATGTVRLLDFAFLSFALAGLPAVLRKMSKLEMEALRNSEEGKRMSKTQLQQRSQENQNAITQVESLRADELGETVRELYGDVVRVKVRPSPAEPRAVLVGSAYSAYFADSPAALSGKYGVEIDAGWQVVGQVNAPRPANDEAKPMPLATGNKMEDAFEQMALLMNNAFAMSAAPAWPNVSFTPIAIYRTVG